jgi:hypothetical protein
MTDDPLEKQIVRGSRLLRQTIGWLAESNAALEVLIETVQQISPTSSPLHAVAATMQEELLRIRAEFADAMHRREEGE